MAGRQGAAGRGRPGAGLSEIQVVVHDLGQLQTLVTLAGELDVPLRPRSAPGAAGYAGVGYLAALERAAGTALIVDCGDDAGLVMGGLRAGLRDIAFSGSDDVARKLADMAAQLGARLRHEMEPADVIALSPDDDVRRIVRLRLDARSRSQHVPASPGAPARPDPGESP